MNQILRPGFIWTIEHWRLLGPEWGKKARYLAHREVVHNLMPTEGCNHALSVLLKGGTQVPTWYIGLYEANYTPILTDTAATFPASATECTAYDEAARVAFVEGAASGGTCDNSASKAEFTISATKTIYGGFLTSASAKGATTGVLLSAVKFASAKATQDNDILRLTAGFTLASV